MSPEIASITIDGMVQVAKWISTIILGAIGLSVTVVLLRLCRKVEFTLANVSIKLEHFPYILVAFSIGHGFLAWVFIQKVNVIIKGGKSVADLAWAKLVNSEAFIFNNMQPRLPAKGFGPFGIDAYSASADDTAFWCALSFAALSTVAFVASRWPSGDMASYSWQKLTDASAASLLAGLNWYIGSVWAINASRLTN